MKNGKVSAYLGFAKKSGALRTGVNTISSLKSANLIIICKTASENTRKDADKLIKKFGCAALLTESCTAEDLADKENCKIIAITNADLASAILDNSKDDFIEYRG